VAAQFKTIDPNTTFQQLADSVLRKSLRTNAPVGQKFKIYSSSWALMDGKEYTGLIEFDITTVIVREIKR
jgi:hypothetical protein